MTIPPLAATDAERAVKAFRKRRHYPQISQMTQIKEKSI
jgi:hypothetical protein